jgi:hypothetical protein
VTGPSEKIAASIPCQIADNDRSPDFIVTPFDAWVLLQGDWTPWLVNSSGNRILPPREFVERFGG